MKPLRIAIVVPGRLHAFELAAALQEQGHEVFVYSNYPVSEALKFGLNPETYRSNVLNRIVMRLWLTIFGHSGFQSLRDRIICVWLDRWALRKIKKDLPFDVIHLFSGVALDTIAFAKSNEIYTQLLRGSAHIETQSYLLLSEAKRASCSADIPSDWMREREKKEYQIADAIIVLSQFALKSFLAQDNELFSEKIVAIPLGINLSVFEPDNATRNLRVKRVMEADKLNVLFAGSFSTRKGAKDFIDVASTFSGLMNFTFVGDVDSLWVDRCRKIAPEVVFLPRVPQHDLPAVYADHDIFFFPTVEDGFAAVIAQALVSGLCVIASENSAAPDLLEHGKSGFIIPAQQSAISIQLLRQLNSEREQLVSIIKASSGVVKSRTWNDVAHDFTEYVRQHKDCK